MRRPSSRWLVPVAVLGIALGANALVGAAGAAAGRPLPHRDAAQLVADLGTAGLQPLSGTVAERADLGIPALPGLSDDSSADWTSLLTGSHTLRVWVADASHARVALTGRLTESDIVRNGTDVWTWSSRDNTATHATLPAVPAMTGKVPFAHPGQPDGRPGGLKVPTTPLEAAQDLVRLADPTTAITVGDTVSVAGRDAYQLVVTPRDPNTLIGDVRIAIDADKHVPLRVQVFARHAAGPAFEIGFTQVSFATPAASVFAFAPPPGAKVTTPAPNAAPAAPGVTGGHPTATVIGSGWSAVLGVRASVADLTGAPAPGTTPNRRGGGADLGSLLARLPKVSGAWGSGHLLQTALVSVLITDDGRVFVGAVPGARLLLDAESPQAGLTAPTPSGTPHR
jgi:hypothetical protein